MNNNGTLTYSEDPKQLQRDNLKIAYELDTIASDKQWIKSHQSDPVSTGARAKIKASGAAIKPQIKDTLSQSRQSLHLRDNVKHTAHSEWVNGSKYSNRKNQSMAIAPYASHTKQQEQDFLYCSTYLEISKNADTGAEFVSQTYSCKNRMCPMCQKVKSNKWGVRLAQVVEQIDVTLPNSKYIMVTLTTPNCTAIELPNAINGLVKSYARLVKLTRFKRATLGTFRSIEITYNSDADTYHPHIHALVCVQSSYFVGRNYLSHAAWVELWQQATKLTIPLVVDVRKVKEDKGSNQSKSGAIAEVAKYSTKPSNYLKQCTTDPRRYVGNGSVIRIMSEAQKRIRLTALSGNMLKADRLIKATESIPLADFSEHKYLFTALFSNSQAAYLHR